MTQEYPWISVYHQKPDGTTHPITGWGVHNYPDGQVQLWWEPTAFNFYEMPIKIAASIQDPVTMHVLEQLLAVTYLPLSELHVLYCYGSRSDKDTQDGKRVFNTAEWAVERLRRMIPAHVNIKLLVPHHDADLDEEEDNVEIIGPALPPELVEYLQEEEYRLLVYPDKSARRRMTNINCLWSDPDANGQKVDDAYCLVGDKTRGAGGEMTLKFDMNEKVRNSINRTKSPYKVLVADDICDGGATFLFAASALKKAMPEANLDMHLYVTHGLFKPASLANLSSYTKVFTTNSVYDGHADGRPNGFPEVITINVWPCLPANLRK